MHVYITVHIWSNATVAVKLVAADTYTYMYVICAQNVYHLLFLYFVAFTHLDLFFCQKKKKKMKQNLKIQWKMQKHNFIFLTDKRGREEKKCKNLSA